VLNSWLLSHQRSTASSLPSPSPCNWSLCNSACSSPLRLPPFLLLLLLPISGLHLAFSSQLQPARRLDLAHRQPRRRLLSFAPPAPSAWLIEAGLPLPLAPASPHSSRPPLPQSKLLRRPQVSSLCLYASQCACIILRPRSGRTIQDSFSASPHSLFVFLAPVSTRHAQYLAVPLRTASRSRRGNPGSPSPSARTTLSADHLDTDQADL